MIYLEQVFKGKERADGLPEVIAVLHIGHQQVDLCYEMLEHLAKQTNKLFLVLRPFREGILKAKQDAIARRIQPMVVIDKGRVLNPTVLLAEQK